MAIPGAGLQKWYAEVTRIPLSYSLEGPSAVLEIFHCQFYSCGLYWKHTDYNNNPWAKGSNLLLKIASVYPSQYAVFILRNNSTYTMLNASCLHSKMLSVLLLFIVFAHLLQNTSLVRFMGTRVLLSHYAPILFSTFNLMKSH